MASRRARNHRERKQKMLKEGSSKGSRACDSQKEISMKKEKSLSLANEWQQQQRLNFYCFLLLS